MAEHHIFTAVLHDVRDLNHPAGEEHDLIYGWNNALGYFISAWPSDKPQSVGGHLFSFTSMFDGFTGEQLADLLEYYGCPSTHHIVRCRAGLPF